MASPDYLYEIAFPYHPAQKKVFQSGKLARHWVKRYRSLFDDDDLRINRTQPNRHFYEWMASVLLFESMGYLSLMEKYDCHSHPRKRKIFERVVGPELFNWVYGHSAYTPDLFVCSPDERDWFFCEVKGTGDQIRPNHRRRFAQLYERTGRRICVLYLNVLPR